MTSALDMSLDDLIKNNKQVGRGGGGGGGGGGAGGRGGRGGGVRRSTANNGAGYGGGGNMGPSRRQFARSAARPTPYATAKVNMLYPVRSFIQLVAIRLQEGIRKRRRERRRIALVL